MDNLFEQNAKLWWDKNGPYRILHKINNLRISFILRCLIDFKIFEGKDSITMLDVGCGGGVASEALAKYNIHVTGIDESPSSIEEAKKNSYSRDRVEYVHSNISNYIKLCKKNNKKFDHICALEVIEHVIEPRQFIIDCLSVLKPGGLIFISTINRTNKALLFAKILAEYILDIIPRGAHEFSKFIKPNEIELYLNEHSCQILKMQGIVFKIKPSFSSENWWLDNVGNWEISDNLDVNYILCAKLLKAPDHENI